MPLVTGRRPTTHHGFFHANSSRKRSHSKDETTTKKVAHEALKASIPTPPKPPVTVSLQGEINFYEVTRRLFIKPLGDVEQIDYAKKKQFIEDLEDYDGCEQDIEELRIFMREGRLDHQLFSDVNRLSDTALWALKKGLISQLFFGTLMMVRAALKTHSRISFIPLFNGEHINKLAEEYLNQMVPCPFEKVTSVLFDKMKHHPREECFFLVTPFVKGPEISLVDRVLEIGLNFLLKIKEKQLRVIPSCELMQASIDARHLDPVKINIVAGRSSWNTIARGMSMGVHDMQVGIKGEETPERADDYLAPGSEYPLHDFYHVMVSSGTELKIRQCLIFFGQVLSTLSFSHRSLSDLKDRLVKCLYDMEIGSTLPVFLKKRMKASGVKEDMIWLALRQVISTSKKMISIHRNSFDSYILTRDVYVIVRALFQKLEEYKSQGYDWDQLIGIDYQTKLLCINKEDKELGCILSDLRYKDLVEDSDNYLDESYLKKVRMRIYTSPAYYATLHYHYRNSRALTKYAVEKNTDLFMAASPRLKADHDFVCELLSIEGSYAYLYADPVLQEDPGIALLALKYNAELFQYMSEKLRGDRKLAIEALRQNLYMAAYIADSLREDTNPELVKLITMGQKRINNPF